MKYVYVIKCSHINCTVKEKSQIAFLNGYIIFLLFRVNIPKLLKDRLHKDFLSLSHTHLHIEIAYYLLYISFFLLSGVISFLLFDMFLLAGLFYEVNNKKNAFYTNFQCLNFHIQCALRVLN